MFTIKQLSLSLFLSLSSLPFSLPPSLRVCPFFLLIFHGMQRELVKLAVKEDSEGNYSGAFKYYRQALQFFVPAIECK